MYDAPRLTRTGGAILAVGAVVGVVSGMTHPQGRGDTFRATFAEMMTGSLWGFSHWAALVAFTLIVWGLWVLQDAGWASASTLAWTGARLAMVGSLLLLVQAAMELVAPVSAEAYAAGRPTPLIDTLEALQSVGWPAHGIGLAMVALGAAWSAPRVVRALGVVGGVAFAVAGILVEGFRVIEAGPLFAVGGLLHLWLAWAGVRAARSAGPVRATDEPPVPGNAAAPAV